MLSQKKSALVLTVLAVVLAVSLFANLYHPSFTEAQPVKVLSVSISGPEKIPFNQTTTYTASVDGSTFGKLTYSWSISPDNDGKTVIVENGDTCTLTYIQPTTDPYTLKVEVRDEAHGFGVGIKTVMDPATFPNLYLGVYGAPYSYMVCVDESGAYYYAINGKTGRVEWSSTNWATVFQNAVDATTSGWVNVQAGTYSSTVALNAKSNVNVEWNGATVTVTSATGISGTTFTGISNCIWQNLNLIRSGNAVIAALAITGATTNTVKFVNCDFKIVTNQANSIAVAIYGVSTPAPQFYNCNFTGGQANHNYGVYAVDTARPSFYGGNAYGGSGNDGYGTYAIGTAYVTMEDFNSYGGSGSTSEYGGYVAGTATLKTKGGSFNGGAGTSSMAIMMADGTLIAEATNFIGGPAGAYGYGVGSGGTASLTIIGGLISAGNGGQYGQGLHLGGSSHTKLVGVNIVGGDGATHCDAAYVGAAATLDSDGCNFNQGSGATDCYSVYADHSAVVRVSGGSMTPKLFTASFTYDSANNGRFRPFTSKAYYQVSMTVYVPSGATIPAGATVDIGTTVGGHEIAEDVPLDGLTITYSPFNLTKQALSADAYMYVTPSASVGAGQFTIFYSVSTNFANCYALRIDSPGASTFNGVNVVSNMASNAVSVESNAVTYPNWLISNCYIQASNPATSYSISAVGGSISNAPVYLSTLVGELNGVTPATGTAAGTNIIK